MQLRFAIGPQDGSNLVHANLTHLAKRRGPLTERSINFAALKVQPPHSVHDLRADQVAAGGGLETARHTGFRYLVHDGAKFVVAAEVHVDATGAASLVNLNYGGHVDASARAVEFLSSHDGTNTGTYETRFLRFSAIPVVAMWLKPDGAGADIIYPLAPVPVGLVADKPCSAADFFDVVRRIAAKRVASAGSLLTP